MESTSGSLPVCVYCGTPRPADESQCPTCGRPWIDVKVDDMADDVDPAEAAPAAAVADDGSASGFDPDPGADGASDVDDGDDDITDELIPVAAPAAAAASAAIPPPPRSALDDTGEFSFDDWTLPPDKPPSRARWIVPILLLLAIIAVWVFVFVDFGSSSTTTIAATDTTVATSTTEAQATTTTTPATTTTAATTTTMAIPPPSVWPPIGDPIPTEDLTLRAAGIGPLDIGSGVGQIAGRLTASLGEAEASGSDGLCEPGEAYWLQWGELRAVFDGFGSGATFVSYRYEDVGFDQNLGLTTLSGLALGDTVQDLQDIYASFTITFEVIDGQDVFRLVDGSELLLWGPVTSTEPDGLVTGIYSPGPCVDG